MKLYSVQEVSKLVGKSEASVKRYIKEGKIKAVRVGLRKLLVSESEAKKIKK
jgi:excisionase family DNA binding protein